MAEDSSAVKFTAKGVTIPRALVPALWAVLTIDDLFAEPCPMCGMDRHYRGLPCDRCELLMTLEDNAHDLLTKLNAAWDAASPRICEAYE